MLAKFEPERRELLQEQQRDRLRWMILRRDALCAEVARMEDSIARESRAYADEQGITVRPSLEQLRRELLNGGREE